MQIVNVRDVGREARAIRKRYMLRQDQVARAAGVSRQWISVLESGKATLALGLVLRVFDELGLDLIAKRRETPPPWTVPLTDEAEDRERRSITRLRRERMQARSRAWSSGSSSLLRWACHCCTIKRHYCRVTFEDRMALPDLLTRRWASLSAPSSKRAAQCAASKVCK